VTEGKGCVATVAPLIAQTALDRLLAIAAAGLLLLLLPEMTSCCEKNKKEQETALFSTLLPSFVFLGVGEGILIFFFPTFWQVSNPPRISLFSVFFRFC